MTDEPKTLLDFIAPEAKARLVALATLQTDARKEVERVREAVVAAEADLATQERLVRRQVAMEAERREAREAAAAAKYLGEAPPRDLPPDGEVLAPVDMGALRETLAGLRRRLTETEKNVQNVEREYKSAQEDELLRTAPRNASTRFVELATELAEVWAVLDAADSINVSHFGAGHAILGTEAWGTLRIPGTENKELRELCQVSEQTMHGPQLFDAGNARSRGLTVAALARLANTFRREVGEYTLDRRR